MGQSEQTEYIQSGTQGQGNDTAGNDMAGNATHRGCLRSANYTHSHKFTTTSSIA